MFRNHNFLGPIFTNHHFLGGEGSVSSPGVFSSLRIQGSHPQDLIGEIPTPAGHTVRILREWGEIAPING